MLLLGCSLPKKRVQLMNTHAPATLRVEAEETLSCKSGYSSKVKENTLWKSVGKINEGTVFKPIDSIFTIQGSHIYQSYIVMNGNEVVGFYLPVSSEYSPISSNKTLKFKQEN